MRTRREQSTRAREGSGIFTVVFYGLKIFGCKRVQFSATLRESDTAESPGVSDAAQTGENARKNSVLKL
jgi:hypothetical protein